ncbi:dihydroneopterin aldolase [Crassaminicella thermophila]|uniref:7,8-dihydroneopterin aldolase n=1 Tax=Crassaminicella thermophila TaxID=2599308 RepID=A0A5C0SAR4_CRATE|nr:dihydroneopterin aldolase [Crassaminicella thermophila]QEK11027.1 dihydroneopterin aldolase [Crassaminicella thermophila]
MDKIIMKNLSFYGYHGAMPEENIIGQKFFVDIDLYLDLKKAGNTDCVAHTVHYGEAYEVVKNIVENKKFNLIEALAENIAKEILEQFSLVKEIHITIRKPEAPVKGIFDYFGVEIRRKQNE